jgi:hypothetical protein
MMTLTRKSKIQPDMVIREVRLVKVRLAEQHGFDVRRIAAASREKQSQSGHEVVSLAKVRD